MVVMVPPVRPVPAVMLVTPPPPPPVASAAQAQLVPLYLRIWPLLQPLLAIIAAVTPPAAMARVTAPLVPPPARPAPAVTAVMSPIVPPGARK